MRIPAGPPPTGELLAKIAGDGDGDPETAANLAAAMLGGRPVDGRGRYLHWDEMRRRTPPEGLTHEAWWLGTALARQSLARALPILDAEGQPFRFSNVDRVQELVHRIDQQAGGHILSGGEAVIGPRARDRYVVSSLIEEAITSSQLEGASTTRRVARELLHSGRPPRDRSERMILNNFAVLEAAGELAASGNPLAPDDVLDLHRVVTEGTLDDERDAGRLQDSADERIAVVWQDGTVLHTPPPAAGLPRRLERLCAFANGEAGEGFLHPVVRAVVLHFGLAYDHPFADGNGRTARALFYWSMLRSGYWLAQYLSISSVLRRAPARYARSYLHVETDRGDLTYFVLYQLEALDRALESLGGYLERKRGEQRRAERLLRDRPGLNHRQHVLVGDALRDPGASFTIEAQSRRHRVAYATARADLLGLEAAGLLDKERIGKKFVFRPSADLDARLAAEA